MQFGTGDDSALYYTGSAFYIDNNVAGDTFIRSTNINLQTNSATSSENSVVGTANSGVSLYYDGSRKFHTGPAGTITVGVSTADGFALGDNEKITFGASEDFKIEHNSNENYIDSNSGHIYIRANVNDDEGDNIYLQPKSGENGITVTHDGAVILYQDGSERFTTTADGADISGTASLKIPVGTTAQRNGSPADGDIRYNSTLNSYEGYGNSAWGGLGGGTEIDTSVSSTSATSITTFAHASYRSASIRIQIVQGSAYQVGRYLLIHDGTTVTLIEESAIATGSMLGTITAAIVSTNVVVYVNMGSSSSATVTTIIDKITV